jgi:cytochrome c oxidase subunit 2
LVALLVAAPGAAANTIGLDPAHSPNTEDTSTLFWISLVVVVALAGAVNVAILLAVRRYRGVRGRAPRQFRSGPGIQAKVAGGLAVLALALFVLSVAFTESARKAPATGEEGLQASGSVFAQRSLSLPEDAEPLLIRATGQQWLWRYEYPNQAFSYYELVVPVDTTVVLNLVSTDVVHSWFVPSLSGKFDAVPGKLNKVYFRADEEGLYKGQSATFSGAAYATMRTAVRVVSPEDYEAYVDQLKRDIEEAQRLVAEQISSEETP